MSHVGSGTSRVRIIGGKWKGRKLDIASPDIRSTPARARVTLFNWLAAELPGARVLDLFAGTGVLGFEALSRGAAHATLIDRDPAAARLLARHRDLLGAEAVVKRADAVRWLSRPAADQRWDVVFLDPPFGSPLLTLALAEVANRLTATGVVYVESDAGFDFEAAHPGGLTPAQTSRAGAVRYGLLRR